MESWYHLDPINLLVVLVSAVSFWVTIKQKVDVHDQTIKGHGTMLERLSESSIKLTTLIEVHDKEIENARHHIHDLGDEIHRRKG